MIFFNNLKSKLTGAPQYPKASKTTTYFISLDGGDHANNEDLTVEQLGRTDEQVTQLDSAAREREAGRMNRRRTVTAPLCEPQLNGRKGLRATTAVREQN